MYKQNIASSKKLKENYPFDFKINHQFKVNFDLSLGSCPVKMFVPFNILWVTLQPKYGGMIIDIVSRDIKTPEQQSEALDAVMNTILYIVLIVVVGYDKA